MLEKVLILSASVGAGHTRAAQAVERALAERSAAREVRHLDTLDYTNPLFRGLYSTTYLEMVKSSPELLGWIYDRLDRPGGFDQLKLAFDKLNARPFIKLLEDYQPQITVCTHPLPAEIISWLKSEGRLAAPQAIVITDFDLHYPWLCDDCEQYFVALDETRAHLEALGVPAGKITVSGIPIDPVFACEKEQQAMRRKHGLVPDRPTLLLTAGGFGVGRIEPILAQLLRLEHAAQVVAVCGRNEQLKEEINRKLAARSAGDRVAVQVIGFTTEIDELMAAADLMLGKPGGLTSSEALARGLPMVIVEPIPGQEERNADHLLEEGAAIRCNNLPVLAYKIDRLLGDRRRLAAMRAHARRLGRPRAAYQVADRLLTLFPQPPARTRPRAHRGAS